MPRGTPAETGARPLQTHKTGVGVAARRRGFGLEGGPGRGCRVKGKDAGDVGGRRPKEEALSAGAQEQAWRSSQVEEEGNWGHGSYVSQAPYSNTRGLRGGVSGKRNLKALWSGNETLSGQPDFVMAGDAAYYAERVSLDCSSTHRLGTRVASLLSVTAHAGDSGRLHLLDLLEWTALSPVRPLCCLCWDDE